MTDLLYASYPIAFKITCNELVRKKRDILSGLVLVLGVDPRKLRQGPKPDLLDIV